MVKAEGEETIEEEGEEIKKLEEVEGGEEYREGGREDKGERERAGGRGQ